MYFVTTARRPTRAFDAMLDHTLDHFFGAAEASRAARTPAMDVTETDDQYTVLAEMPGVAKEDVKVSIDGRRVSIAAQAKTEAASEDAPRTVLRERTPAQWARTFTLPLEIDQAVSSAKLEHGVLTLVLGKKRAPGAAHLTIN